MKRKAFWKIFLGAALALHAAFLVITVGTCAALYYESLKYGKNLPAQSVLGWFIYYLCILGAILPVAYYSAQKFNSDEHQAEAKHQKIHESW